MDVDESVQDAWNVFAPTVVEMCKVFLYVQDVHIVRPSEISPLLATIAKKFFLLTYFYFFYPTI